MSQGIYRVNRQLADLSWVDFDLDVPPIPTHCQSHSAKIFDRKKSEIGIAKIIVNVTQVREVMVHPVQSE